MKSKRKTDWILIVLSTLIAVAFLGFAELSASAQEPEKATPEVQQLREKLQKLEQTVQELKTQLTAMEQPRIAPAAAKPEQPATSPPAEQPTAAGNNKQDDKKGETTFQVYGFAMLDMGYQFKQNHPDWFDTVRPTKLPSFKDEFAPDGKTFFSVRQSRLGVKSTTATRFGELKTTFEFELFGTGVDAGQTTFRLRHAYGELGQFGAGQWWTTFGDTDAYPNSLEYWGPNGLVWFRNVQVRWMPLKGKNAVIIALERPGASGDQGTFADRIELQGIRSKFDLPDLVGNVKFTRDWGHFQIAGLVRRIKWVDTINDQFDLSGSAIGWGTSLSSSLNFGKKDVGRFQVTYGSGIENYLNDAPVDVAVKKNPSDPLRPIKGVALPALGMSSFLDHTWSKRFSSAVGYSLVNIENSDGQAPNAYHRGQYGLANLLFYPYDNVMVGGEFQWGRRQNAGDGFVSNDYRVQFSFKYNFSRIFALPKEPT